MHLAKKKYDGYHDIYYTPHAPDNHLLALLALMEPKQSRKSLRSRPDVDRMVKLMTLAKRPDAADALANVNFSRGLPSKQSPGKPKHGGGRLKHKVMASPPEIDYRPSCATSMALVLRDADTLGGVRARKKPALFDPDLDGLSDRHKLQRLQDEAERNHEDESPSALSTCGSAASDSVVDWLIGQRVSGMPVRGYGKHNGKISAVCGATDCQMDWDDGTSSWVSRSQAMKYLEKQPEPIRTAATRMHIDGAWSAAAVGTSVLADGCGSRPKAAPKAARKPRAAEQHPMKVLCDDISRGHEPRAIPCLALVDSDQRPPDFRYVTALVHGSSSRKHSQVVALDSMLGCDCCADGTSTSCSDEGACACARRSQLDRTEDNKRKPGFAYSSKTGLLRKSVRQRLPPHCMRTMSSAAPHCTYDTSVGD